MSIKIKKQEKVVAPEKGFGLKSLFPQPVRESVDALGDWLGTGARIGSGWFGASGGVPGAIAGGAGEALAQFLESSIDPATPGRIAVEAGMGAIPFGRVAGGRRLLTAMGKTAGVTAGGDVMRQLAEGNFGKDGAGWDKSRTLQAGVLGGLTGAAYNKLQPGVAPIKTDDVIIESSGAVPKSADIEPQDRVIASGGKAQSAGRAEAQSPNYQGGVREIQSTRPTRTIPTPPPTGRAASRVPIVGDAPTEKIDEEGTFKLLDRLFKSAMNRADTREATLAKEAADRAATRNIEAAKEGLGEGRVTVTETVKAPGATKTTRYTRAADDDAFDNITPELAERAAASPETATQVENAMRGTSSRVQQLLANLDDKGLESYNYYRNYEGDGDLAAYKKALAAQAKRRTPVRVQDATGNWHEIPPQTPTAQVRPPAEPQTPPANPVAEVQKVLTPDARVQGLIKNLDDLERMQQLRQTTHPSFYDEGFEGLDDANDLLQRQQSVHPSFYDDSADALDIAPGKSTIPPATASKLAQAEQTYPPEMMEELKTGKELATLRDFFTGKGKFKKPGDETGAANIEAQLGIALSGVGALTGGAIDAAQGDDSVLDGIIGGAVAGGAVPFAPQALAALKSSVDPTNLEQVKEAASNFVAKMPQIQRASLLANPQGAEQGMPAILANSWAGPYGAVMTAAIEAILKDDPRGWTLLKEAYNPAQFIKGWWNSDREAYQALLRGEEGRAGHVGTFNPDSKVEKLLAMPGQMMTMGDIYARKLMTQAGFSPQETMEATLTSEPGKAWRPLSNVAKNNWLLQMMFPFRRTPTNIMEQGLRRTPGAGFFVGPDRPFNEKIVEQGLGTAFGAGSGVLAANIEDDTTRRNVRRLASNLPGRYSLPSQIGYTIGDAFARDLPSAKSVINRQNVENIFPLPATDVIVDTTLKGWNALDGVESISEVIPETMTFMPLRRFIGDQDPSMRPILGVEPPPRRGIRIPRPPQRQQ